MKKGKAAKEPAGKNTPTRRQKVLFFCACNAVRSQMAEGFVKALYGDSLLSEQLVLKGGNALALAYRVGGRTSLDLDFSIEGDFDDLPEISVRMERALTEAFSAAGIRLFDFQLESRPKGPVSDWWGGYSAEFKLMPESRARELGQSVDEMRRQALTIDPGSQRRKYTVEISKHEFCGDKRLQRIDDFGVRVYSPLLLAAEKLRALLQQHPDYPQIDLRKKRSRARDLYDIWVISDHFSIRLEMNLATVRSVFGRSTWTSACSRSFLTFAHFIWLAGRTWNWQSAGRSRASNSILSSWPPRLGVYTPSG